MTFVKPCEKLNFCAQLTIQQSKGIPKAAATGFMNTFKESLNETVQTQWNETVEEMLDYKLCAKRLENKMFNSMFEHIVGLCNKEGTVNRSMVHSTFGVCVDYLTGRIAPLVVQLLKV